MTKMLEVQTLADTTAAASAGKSTVDVLDVLQSLLTIAAIIAGAIWTWTLYRQKRQKYPRANIKHSLSCWRFDDDKKVLRVTVHITNVSEVLLEVVSGEVWVRMVRPWPQVVKNAVENGTDLAEGANTKGAEWPIVVDCEWKEGETEIEPGETDQLHFDFSVGNALETVIVYSHLHNETKKHRLRFWKNDKEIGWLTETTHELPFNPKTGMAKDDRNKNSEKAPQNSPKKGRKPPLRERKERKQEDSSSEKLSNRRPSPLTQKPKRDRPAPDETASELGKGED